MPNDFSDKEFEQISRREDCSIFGPYIAFSALARFDYHRASSGQRQQAKELLKDYLDSRRSGPASSFLLIMLRLAVLGQAPANPSLTISKRSSVEEVRTLHAVLKEMISLSNQHMNLVKEKNFGLWARFWRLEMDSVVKIEDLYSSLVRRAW